MTWTAVGSLNPNSATGSFSFTPSAVGDLIVIGVGQYTNGTVYATALSSSNVTWTAVTHVEGSSVAQTAALFLGNVTSTTAETVTITWSGTAPTGILITAQEFSSSVGSWSVDVSGTLNSAGTDAWPTLTPTGTGELYAGWALDSSSAVAGTTSGFTYDVDFGGNGYAYDLDVSAATGPVWGDSDQVVGCMVLVKETGSTPATVTGVTAPSVLTATPGTVAGDKSAVVQGVTALSVLAATPGTVAGDNSATVTGVTALSVLAATPGTVVGDKSAVVQGVTALSVLAAAPGTVVGDKSAVIQGVTALSGLTATPGTPSGGSSWPSVSGASPGVAWVGAFSPGVLTQTGSATVTGVTAPSVLAAAPGTVAGDNSATVTGVTAPSVLAAAPGTVVGDRSAVVQGVTALSVLAATPGTVVGDKSAVVQGVTALSVLAAAPGVPTGNGGPLPPAPYGGNPIVFALDSSVAVVADTFGSGVAVVNEMGAGLVFPTVDGALQLLTLDTTVSVVADTMGADVVVDNTFGLGVTESTVQVVDITLNEFNDISINLAITQSGSAFNLTGYNLQMLLKTAAGTPDDEALVLSSTGSDPAITITNASGGLATVAIPNSDLQTEEYTFYRVDVLNSSSDITTCAYGTVSWISL